MKSSVAMFVFITGLLMTFGAVGGIEVSVTNMELMSSHGSGHCGPVDHVLWRPGT
jgi:hypothetical protein